MAVEVVHWNPKRAPGDGRLRRLRRRKSVNNFGDLLGPLIVERVADELGLVDHSPPDEVRRLLSVGSILALARVGDTVWGSGVNGKALDKHHHVEGVSIRAVRGPRSAAFLAARGAQVPSVYGDPGLLAARYWPHEAVKPTAWDSRVLLVPNFHDLRLAQSARVPTLSPQSDVMVCLAAIASSSFVIASSLHGGIVAESYGLPMRFLRSTTEPEFKYRDYLEATGRTEHEKVATTVDEAMDLGPHEPLTWSSAALLATFPSRLWSRRRDDADPVRDA
jgi:pyruvyltransferase